MKKILITVVAIIIIIVGIIFFGINFMMPKPDLSLYEHLKTPQISEKENQKMLVVEAKGDPNETGKEAFKLLFQNYFKLPGVEKGPKQPAPRARWPISADTPKDQWVGIYAMPVPNSITELKDTKAQSGLKMYLSTWDYGTVAEILHIGPYSQEQPTINKLHQFIQDNGYEIIGEHEEEYIKGPTMFGPGNPDEYYTVIRYPVQKAIVDTISLPDSLQAVE